MRPWRTVEDPSEDQSPRTSEEEKCTGTTTRTTRILLLSVVMFGAAVAAVAQNRIDVEMVDGAVSVEADRVELGTLLGELDRVAGTSSEIPGALETRLVSVAFSPLPLGEAIERVFQGLALDYAVVGEHRIVVLAESRSLPPTPVRRAAPATVGTAQPPSQASGAGAFALPGGRSGEDPAAVNAPVRVGARGAEQIRQVRPDGRVPNPGLPGLGTPLPFGVLPDPPGAPRADSPAPAFIGNTAPAILDLNQQPTRSEPAVPPAPPFPGPQPNP